MKLYMVEEKLYDEEIFIYYMYIKELFRLYLWECLVKLLIIVFIVFLRIVLVLAFDIEVLGCWDIDILVVVVVMICEGRGRFISAYIVGDIGEEVWRGVGIGLSCLFIFGCFLYMVILKLWNL